MPRVTLRVRRIVDDRIIDPTTRMEIPKDHPVEVAFHGEIMRAIARGELERIVREPTVVMEGAPPSIITDRKVVTDLHTAHEPRKRRGGAPSAPQPIPSDE